MLRGLYTAAAGMISQQNRHDTITNNIANMNTPGYKQKYAVTHSFPDMLLRLTGSRDVDNGQAVGKLSTGVFAEESLQVNLQGDLMQTNRFSDFAIVSDIQVPGVAFDASGKALTAGGRLVFQPQAFFTVQNKDGETRYTRDGQFRLDEQGYMTLPDGSRVLGADGRPFRLPDGVTINDLAITADNRLVNPLTGASAGQLLITRVDDPNKLVREGDGKFKLADGETGVRPVNAGDRVEVRQGYVERSNVDAAQSMVDLMSAARAYEANQKVIQFYDKSMDKAVNEIGRV
ncbi:flagellar basal-body rod protein FlgG [Paenibacillus sp. UNC496MF]|uniref:flagellar hook-basal body protein n=1 Tax=Paenibacillus sp. UNC496MF TaxID=1502753 RepID=UPI0008EF81C3|nr:flagellar hook-basal body protein [Paenibacillus sp. UNC496MF]SFJ26263.1 flagellar basal-body rod protein FlgG [Paenibacillus sp. UNC496MF]